MLSIVIPVLNEAATVEELLMHLEKKVVSDVPKEIIFIDGGSKDDTVPLIKRYASEKARLPISVLRSPKGRAIQMNEGARRAQGTILYFLHADSFPPHAFDQHIIRSVLNGKTAGCFRMKFDNTNIILMVSQWFTRFNLKACRGGDQSLFVSREIFETLNGYNENYNVYEDCEFIGRIYDNYGFTVINDYVITSARRYAKNGTLKLQYHFAVIHLKKWMGADAYTLNNYYNKYIIS